MKMLARVTQVQPVRDYILHLTFDDGLDAEVDLRERIVGRGGPFSALEAPEFFRQARIDPDFGTLVWPNDVDFCPEVLHEWATASLAAKR